jgi:hypothetical protein
MDIAVNKPVEELETLCERVQEQGRQVAKATRVAKKLREEREKLLIDRKRPADGRVAK